MTSAPSHIIDPAQLAQRKPTRFALEPDAAQLKAMTETLGIPALKRFRFTGELRPASKSDWQLTADLGATAVQDCVITLEPVTTRIDQPITRRFIADWHAPEGAEVEMPEDTDAEPLPPLIDLYEIALEALSLALPAWPRKDDAELGSAQFAESGVAPMTDADAKPFAALKGLRDDLAKD